MATSYRSTARFNIISKIIEFIIARRTNYSAETRSLLRTHMGARKTVSTEHTLHYMMERIYAAWNRGEVVSVLLLDVSVPYGNLLHNLRRKRMNERIVKSIEAFLSDRTTILKTCAHETEKMDISVNIPPGSSLSFVFFLFYNA